MKLQTRRAECHPDRAHYAGGLCAPCYRASWQREKRQRDPLDFRLIRAACHPLRPHYAAGLCASCYNRKHR